jgi:hypothetical protein
MKHVNNFGIALVKLYFCIIFQTSDQAPIRVQESQVLRLFCISIVFRMAWCGSGLDVDVDVG